MRTTDLLQKDPMTLAALLQTGKPLFSFEFFPPKDDAAATSLMQAIQQLQTLSPDYVSVTYGAGGSTRTKTLDLVTRIKRETGIEGVAHLTCVGHSKNDIQGILDELATRGVQNILALRGDPPKGQTEFKPHPDGYRYANELAAGIAKDGRFCFGVAGYPEKHPEAPSLEADLVNLKRKVDAGASFVTTQLFFHNASYFDFVARAKAIGIRVPIQPGIMPVTNLAQIRRFADLCGATLPANLLRSLESAHDDPEAVARVGIEYATEQCRQLLEGGAPGIHFYTLNKSRATQEILTRLADLRST